MIAVMAVMAMTVTTASVHRPVRAADDHASGRVGRANTVTGIRISISWRHHISWSVGPAYDDGGPVTVAIVAAVAWIAAVTAMGGSSVPAAVPATAVLCGCRTRADSQTSGARNSK